MKRRNSIKPADLSRATNNSNENNEDEICELEHLRKLFIGGLHPSITEESLRIFYQQWGTLEDCKVMRDMETQKSRGFGFVTYTKAAMVDKAQNARPHVIAGKEVESKRALPRAERENPEINVTVRKLFVGGLKHEHDEDCLREYFSKFGRVVGVKIPTDRITGRSRGFAYIDFSDYDAVDKAILHKDHSIKYVLLDVKKSVYKRTPAVADDAGKIPPHNPPGQYQPGPPPMNGPPQPPINFNNWGPPANYNGYNQPPMNNWNQPPQWNQANYGPPQGNWNAGQSQSQQQPPQSFGNGYQQNYGGGPQKNNFRNNVRNNPFNNRYSQQQVVPPVNSNTRF